MKPILNASRTLALAIGAVLLGGAIATQASENVNQGDENPRSIAVQYSDLNLSTPAGIEALYQRLRVAARTVCAPEEDRRNLAMYRDWKRCYESALDIAVSTAAQPALSEHHLARTGRPVKAAATIAKTE